MLTFHSLDSTFVVSAFSVTGMSVLNDFVRIRLYRKQAAEFQLLADNTSVPAVQRRYRTIARHYSELAEREEQADRARMAGRLEELRRKRWEATAGVPRSGVQLLGSANDNLAIGFLRLMQICERVRRQRAAQSKSSGLMRL